MKYHAVRLAFTLALLALLCLSTSCYTKPEKSEAFIGMRNDVSGLREDLESTNSKITRNEDEIFNLATKVKDISSRDPASSVPSPAGAVSPEAQAEIKALENRVLNLETNLTKTLAKQKELSDRLAKMEASPATGVTPPPKPGGAAPARPTATPTRAPASKRGVYRPVEQGDTLASIAQRYNITVKALCEANQLAVTAKPLAGQQIFIPGR